MSKPKHSHVKGGVTCSFLLWHAAFGGNESETPGTQAFDELHYSHLPTGLANCPQLQCQDSRIEME